MAARAPKVANKLKTLALVCTGGGLVFSGLCIYQGQEQYYEKILMPATRLLPPETSHKLAVWACKYKLFGKSNKPDDAILQTDFFGLTLTNPLGIAAGFDKQGEAVEGLSQIGFGFVEIGSVTPEPQPGNPLPRVFRLVEDEAIINRYGFNSEGHAEVFKRLKALKDSGNFQGVLGINLGKNKTSPSAKEDYRKGVLIFGPIADYLVINISSPNTPGLRDLQGKKDLEALLETVIKTRNELHANNKVPVLLKLAPDLTQQDIKDIAAVVNKKSCRVDGLIVSNTTIARDNLKEVSLTALETGGLSGVPLRSKSTALIAEMYYQTGGKIPIMGVGGISSGQDAYEKIEAGASYLQLYTSFIFHGPPIVKRVKSELAEILKAKNYKSITEAVGSNYKHYLNK
ncbi:dihydroorotate dehydrogenase (quinone), mitochondrial [Lucilia cuprina]|uniref:dihydroorotate dehydrogenase (quinone), mitochondrial n=1 Tax=Lucilia cuprina TaxID=7375 RepID=UPI001F053403|nr:dihydroorotate dehydrogenase (quinone), mitochondrial [Lucilia cuprina]